MNADWITEISVVITAIVGVVFLVIATGKIGHRISKWSGSVDTDRENFKKFIQEVKSDIKELFSRLPPPVIKSGSPLVLTDFGKEISKLAAGSKWATKTAIKFLDQIEGKKPYQVQKFAFEVAENDEYFSDKEYERIQEAAYERGIDEKLVRQVLGVELRDKLLEMTAE